MWIIPLAEEAHAEAVRHLVAASFVSRSYPRLAERLVEEAADAFKTVMPPLTALDGPKTGPYLRARLLGVACG